MVSHIKTADFLANFLDNKFSLFGKRFGFNGILGLIPWVGDLLSLILSLYILWVGMELRLPVVKIIDMSRNILINFAIGLIPIAGDYIDFFHKANLENMRIIKEHVKNYEFVEGEFSTA